MYSLSFPSMFTSTTTKLITDNEATKSNLSLVLQSNKKAFIFDPDFGCDLGYLFFEQDGSVIPELVTDRIFSAIQLFMPQLIVKREDIKLVQDGDSVKINLTALNLINYEIDNYSIRLLDSDT